MPENANREFRFTHWPTDYPVVTQTYNNAPDYYGRWGLTGHEGIDVQAPQGSPIYAVAPGTVVRVRAEAENHAYGNAVYVRHDGGYRTAYAHLQAVHVRQGEAVTGGQPIGRAGMTGNSQGPHLHLTLYKEGASAQGETRQPHDIVDPTPFLDPLLNAGWEAPQPPLVGGWGWADSIELRDGLGRVSNAGGINLRARPATEAAKVGLLPQGAVVRLTGSRRNNYFPLEAAAADVLERTGETAPAGPADRAYSFVTFHSTAGDYRDVQPGRAFTATWTVRNSGRQPWAGDYRLTYVEATTPETENDVGARMGAKATYTLRELAGRDDVPPGDTIALPLTLVAPRRGGWFASHWQLQTPAGEPMGRPLWLRVNVRGAYRDFVAPGAPDDGAKGADLFGEPDAEFLRFATTLDDYTAVPAGSSFTNRWTFRNSGEATWGDGYRLVYAPEGTDSAPLAAQTDVALADVASFLPADPGDEVTVTLAMRAPAQFGRHYQSRWELHDAEGNAFGHLYAEITVVARSTVGTGVQHADMAFVRDHTVPDDTRFPEGQTFLKQWRVRNTGARKWGNGFRLVFVEGDLAMARGVTTHMVPDAARNEEVILSVPMVAPPVAGTRPVGVQSLWRLQDDRGNVFGAPIWARIITVPSGAAAALGRFADPSLWYSQLDPRWKDDRLGHGRQTIGDWGCLLICYAMMLHALGLRVDPAGLNERLRGLGDDGFRGSDVQFVGPTRLLSGLQKGNNLRSWPNADVAWSEWTGENPIERIDRALAAGHVVLAQVDRTPNNAYYHSDTEQHWVILVARTEEGRDYLMLDPITPAGQLHNQPTSLMRKYGNPAPSRPHEENLRNAIKSALVYRYGS